MKAGQVAYITTGSKMPKGADAVSKQASKHRDTRGTHMIDRADTSTQTHEA